MNIKHAGWLNYFLVVGLMVVLIKANFILFPPREDVLMAMNLISFPTATGSSPVPRGRQLLVIIEPAERERLNECFIAHPPPHMFFQEHDN